MVDAGAADVEAGAGYADQTVMTGWAGYVDAVVTTALGRVMAGCGRGCVGLARTTAAAVRRMVTGGGCGHGVGMTRMTIVGTVMTGAGVGMAMTIVTERIVGETEKDVVDAVVDDVGGLDFDVADVDDGGIEGYLAVVDVH